MIKPVNNHLLIEPLKHETFMASQRETYEEVGVIIATPGEYVNPSGLYMAMPQVPPKAGDRVYFDSYLAAKYPRTDKPDEFYWLVRWEDVRAIEHAEALPE